MASMDDAISMLSGSLIPFDFFLVQAKPAASFVGFSDDGN
jgi:hypothetical protein